MSDLESLKGKAYGQFSSCSTMRPETTEPVEIELTDQEDMFGGEHTIDLFKEILKLRNQECIL